MTVAKELGVPQKVFVHVRGPIGHIKGLEGQQGQP